MTTTDEWEYRTVEGPRKGPEPYSLEDEGWERDYSQGRPGEAWDRFDHHEEYYWKRRRTHDMTYPDAINVLDHGLVRLVDHMGSDLSVVRAARVSYDAAWRAGEDEGSDARLIRYLWKNKHTSPFEAVEFQFEVKAPIFVFRQWHRHRTWAFNELSARYRELPSEFYVPDPALIGVQATNNKQARVVGGLSESEVIDRTLETRMLKEACENAFGTYHHLLNRGWPRELARSVLPVNTYSHMFAKIDLRNLLGFLDLRLHEHAQYEIRVYAEAMLQLARSVAPVCIEAWESGR